MKLTYNTHTGRYVLINEMRDQRKDDFVKTKDQQENCPFCPGQLKDMNCLRYEHRIDDKWVTRSIDNKYPALLCDEELHESGEIDYGKHEVMIECREHLKSYYDFSMVDFERVVEMFKNRYIELNEDEKTESVVIYKNHLKSAGASKIHSHSQILSMSFIAPELEKELSLDNNQQIDTNCIIRQTANLIAYAPCDAYLSGEVIITHKQSQRFDLLENNETIELAELMQHIFGKIKKIYGAIPFNLFVHSLPKNAMHKHFKWHVHIIPRKGNFGGFELSTGLYINSLNIHEMVEQFK